MSQLLGLKTCPPPVPSLAAGQPGRSLCGLCACRVPRPRPACLPASEATLFRTAADAIRPSRGQKLRPLPAPRVSSVLCARSFGAFVGPGVPESRPRPEESCSVQKLPRRCGRRLWAGPSRGRIPVSLWATGSCSKPAALRARVRSGSRVGGVAAQQTGSFVLELRDAQQRDSWSRVRSSRAARSGKASARERLVMLWGRVQDKAPWSDDKEGPVPGDGTQALSCAAGGGWGCPSSAEKPQQGLPQVSPCSNLRRGTTGAGQTVGTRPHPSDARGT